MGDSRQVTGQGRQLDQNGPLGPGGVCASPPVAEPAIPDSLTPDTRMIPPAPESIEAMARPLIPEQPLPPGAPVSLAAALRGELSPPSTDLSTAAHHEPSARAHEERSPSLPTGPVPGLMGSVGHGLPPGPAPKSSGKPHPFKPVTQPQIAEFAGLWHDPAFTNEMISARYRTVERTIQRWRVEFGLLPRDQAVRAGLRAHGIMDAAQGVVDRVNEVSALTRTMDQAPVAGQVMPGVSLDRLDPFKDPEIVEAMNAILAEARVMTGHSDLQVLQRRLARLAVLATAKVPVRTWDSLATVVESLSRTVLYMRRVEAEVPSTSADPVLLRKEAASQMMREMKSVLAPGEQAELARLVKMAADRLMAKGAQAGKDALIVDAEATQ